MYFVKFANISNSKISAKGREEGSATHKWMLLGKGNFYEGVLTIVEKPKSILVELSLNGRSKFKYTKALRFAEVWAAKHGYHTVAVTLCFSLHELEKGQSYDNVWQAEQCLARGYSFSPIFTETVTINRSACENITWVQRRLSRTTEQSGFNSKTGYRILRYEDIPVEDIEVIHKSMQGHFASYVCFRPDSKSHDRWLSHLIYKGDLVVAFLSVSIRKPGAYYVECLSAHRDYPGAGMLAMKQLAYDIGKYRPDCKTISCEFINKCNDGRRLLLTICGSAICGYTRRVYLRKALNKRDSMQKTKLDIMKFVLGLENTLHIFKV